MGIVIGIDVGGSTTKIVGINKGQIQSPMFITATDPVTSLFGAFGKYIYDNGIQLSDVEQVMLTGVGSAFVDSPLYGLPTRKTDEFIANGLGARHATDIDQLIVVSMGTGTSFVKISGDEIQHIGGMGIGGGTLQGLSRLLLKTHDIHRVADLAAKGDVTRVNLQIGDICNNALPDLPVSATASLFGKADSNASQEDIACGIIYTVPPDHRRSGCAFRTEQSGEGFRADRQSHSVAAMPGSVPENGKHLSCALSHSILCRISYGYRGSFGIRQRELMMCNGEFLLCN